MQLVINIPDNYKERLDKEYLNGINGNSILVMDILAAVVIGKPLPDDATNGDVIQALFPNIEKDNERLIQEYGSQALYDTFERWCSLPYKVGDTDG